MRNSGASKAKGANQLFDTSIFSVWHPRGSLRLESSTFEPYVLPTVSASHYGIDRYGIDRYCPHFELLSNIAAGCGVVRDELAATNQYCGYFVKEDYGPLRNLAGRQGESYHQTCFCMRLSFAVHTCHSAVQAMRGYSDGRRSIQLLPESVFEETDPVAIAAGREAIQEMVNEAYRIYEALIIARIVAKGISNVDDSREMAGVLFLNWNRQIGVEIAGMVQGEIHYIDMAPKLCPEAPPYRDFEGIMS